MRGRGPLQPRVSRSHRNDQRVLLDVRRLIRGKCSRLIEHCIAIKTITTRCSRKPRFPPDSTLRQEDPDSGHGGFSRCEDNTGPPVARAGRHRWPEHEPSSKLCLARPLSEDVATRHRYGIFPRLGHGWQKQEACDRA